MKISLSTLVDISVALQTKAGQELSQFIQYSQQTFGELILAVKGNLTLEDNIRGTLKTVELVHGTPVTVGNLGSNIIGISAMRVLHPSDACTLNWYVSQKGEVVVTAYFHEQSTEKRSVQIFAWRG